MTAGVAVILGPAGMNLGAGMTGGLAYLLRDSIGGYGYNQHSVRLAPVEVREEVWLRRVLRKHLRLTGSPRAAALLNAAAPLPFLRVEPLALPCYHRGDLGADSRPGSGVRLMPAVYTVPIFATGCSRSTSLKTRGSQRPWNGRRRYSPGWLRALSYLTCTTVVAFSPPGQRKISSIPCTLSAIIFPLLMDFDQLVTFLEVAKLGVFPGPGKKSSARSPRSAPRSVNWSRSTATACSIAPAKM